MPTLPEPVFTVYRTTCLVNGKIYIGVHKTRNPDDAYLGSGKLISRAVGKYGGDAFTKEVLFVFDTRTEAYAREKELVHEAFVKRADTYNLMVGGVESPGWYESQVGEKNSQYGTRWVWKKGEKSRKVGQSELTNFLEEGWALGRVPRGKPAPKKPRSGGNKTGKNTRGKVWIHRGDEARIVARDQVALLLEKGFTLGMPESTSQIRRGQVGEQSSRFGMERAWICHPLKGRLQVRREELQSHLDKGWRTGMV